MRDGTVREADTVVCRSRRDSGEDHSGTASAPKSRGHRLRLAVLGVIVAVGVSGCAVATPAATPRPATSAAPSVPSPSPMPAPSSAPLTVGQVPAAVTVRAMELSESLIGLGLLDDGSMEVPSDFGDVGWFTGGGRPGGIGPTVIAGHVDSSSGPAVFSRLRELVSGDLVQVTDATGAMFDYEVYEVGDYPKADFPTARVFGAIPRDEVRLITCTGIFDSSIGHYEDNRVVFGSRVKPAVG